MPKGQSSRVTIADVAAAAGVSKMTVSMTMNDRPGISAQTRGRVREAAAALGWEPDSTARRLAGAGAGAVGLVIRRPAHHVSADTFYMQLIAAMGSHLTSNGLALTLNVAESVAIEEEIYASFARRRSVDAVLVTDVAAEDPRAELLAGLGLPSVALGGPGTQFATLAADVSSVAEQIVDHLGDRGHRCLGRVATSPDFYYSRARSEAFAARAATRGLTVHVLEGAMTMAESEAMTGPLLESGVTALVYDSDPLMLGGLAAARRSGRAVPEDVAVVSWDGSGLTPYLTPAPTLIRRDVAALGIGAAEALMAATRTPPGPGFLAEGRDLSLPTLQVGETT
ncbi:LacI family transcriptional regulator [Ruania suaedae]|uniref:LacI family DNA-binding transcriptional regulator n=1 Tax=Ruania suaedae TaxID=2897774 RepID=UPI001E352AC7|nr:LacI family DNA-binding transcriptional regulator [Ruania suaedae]UFU02712.1 LacI family transcriptional regulator [Ruania suaedae]